MSEVLKTLTHKDVPVDVVLKHGNVTFELRQKEGDGYLHPFTSFEAAKAKVDELLTTKARLKARELDVSHHCMDENGTTMTLKGLNRQDGSARVSGYKPGGREQKTYDGRVVYADRPWVREALAEYRHLRTRLREVEQKLDPVSTRLRTYHGRVDLNEYVRVMTRLTQELETADRRAVELESETK